MAKRPNLTASKSFDDFLQKNNIEVISFQNGVFARWKSTNAYKSGIYRVSETQINKIVGKDYDELTEKIKKELKKLFRFPWKFFLATLFTVSGSIVFAKEGSEIFLLIAFLVFATLFAFETILQIIETYNARRIISSKSKITRDFMKHSLFANERIYKDAQNKTE